MSVGAPQIWLQIQFITSFSFSFPAGATRESVHWVRLKLSLTADSALFPGCYTPLFDRHVNHHHEKSGHVLSDFCGCVWSHWTHIFLVWGGWSTYSFDLLTPHNERATFCCTSPEIAGIQQQPLSAWEWCFSTTRYILHRRTWQNKPDNNLLWEHRSSESLWHIVIRGKWKSWLYVLCHFAIYFMFARVLLRSFSCTAVHCTEHCAVMKTTCPLCCDSHFPCQSYNTIV